MKISILTLDFSHNCLSRAYLLSQILKRRYEVEIIGPAFNGKIWKPLAHSDELDYKIIEGRFSLRFFLQLKETLGKITSDVIYACKPLFTSFGIGLLKKMVSNKPLILDIDDWQMGLIREGYKNFTCAQYFRKLVSSALNLHNVTSYWNSLIGEKMACFADEITVSSNFLKDEFGGTIIRHGTDPEVYNPEKFNKNQLREKYGIGKDEKVVMFCGTPRPHKGLGDLIEAAALIPDMLLVLVGLDEADDYSQNLRVFAKKKLGDKKIRIFELQLIQDIPEFLAMADVIAIPQKRNFATAGQMPTKVYEGMAMAKPIIATNVSDLPEILKDCGWIVEPEAPEQLAKAIQYIFDHPEEAKVMGWRAREKCIAAYSYDAIGKALVTIFSKYESRLK